MNLFKIGDKVTFNILSEEDKDREEGRIIRTNDTCITLKKTNGNEVIIFFGGSLIKTVKVST
jgi:hypothetical protein